jgi:exodeoxyribonuclease VII large subunit
METHRLFELHQFIRRAIALNLPDPIWVSCEIHQLNFSREHYFLTLVEKGDNGEELVAQADGVIWKGQIRQLRRSLGTTFTQLLKEGMEVKLLVKVDFHERYGYKLVIEDIDPTYTLGKLAIQREAVLQQLKQEGLLKLNKQFSLPTVIQKIAVISSQNAAGLQDFIQQLEQNHYAYQFQWQLFEAAVQGTQVEKEVVHQLKKISRSAHKYDCIAILRGGGARLDLAGFDKYKVCEAAAKMPVPVLSGIGHETDEALLDLVVHTALKTPTAVADFIIQRNLHFEAHLEQLLLQTSNLVNQMIKEEQLELQKQEQRIQEQALRLIRSKERILDRISENLPLLVKIHTSKAQQQLEQYMAIIELLNPAATFKRGYSLVTKDGENIHSAKHLNTGDMITTHFEDGTIKSEVQ